MQGAIPNQQRLCLSCPIFLFDHCLAEMEKVVSKLKQFNTYVFTSKLELRLIMIKMHFIYQCIVTHLVLEVGIQYLTVLPGIGEPPGIVVGNMLLLCPRHSVVMLGHCHRLSCQSQPTVPPSGAINTAVPPIRLRLGTKILI